MSNPSFSTKADVVLEGTEHGVPYALVLNDRMGNWLAYVALHRTHPWFLMSEDKLPLDVHGGITFAADPHADDEWRWVGWDYAHAGDYVPMMYKVCESDHVWKSRDVMAHIRTAAADVAAAARTPQ